MTAPRGSLHPAHGLIIDEDARRVTLHGDPVALTRSGYALLTALAARPHHALAARELLEAMWGGPWETDTTPLQTHVSRLRGKLGESASAPRFIVTVHGFGYRFEPEPVAVTSAEVAEHQLVSRHQPAGEPALVYALFAPDRTCMWIGQHVERLLGWQPSDIIGTTVYDWAHPDDRPGMLAVRAELDEGHVAAIIIRLRTPSGDYRHVEALIRPVIGSDGSLNAFLAEWKPGQESARTIAATGLCDPRQPNSNPPRRTVELSFDDALRLTRVQPHEPFLGYAPDDVIGTAFSPTGIATPVLLGVVAALIAAGTNRIDGMVDMFTAGGDAIRIRVEQELLVDADGHFAGMHSTLHLAD